MIKIFFLISAFLLFNNHAWAVTADQAGGIGPLRCSALDFKSASVYLMAENWIFGFWYSMNINNIDQNLEPVGKTQDAENIVPEVVKYCAVYPQKTLAQATANIYLKFSKLDRNTKNTVK